MGLASAFFMPDGNNKGAGYPTVSVVRCNTYDPEAVMEAVRKAVDLVGGTAAFVSEGEKILLKPNMLVPRRPDEAITTHPEVLRATIKLVKEAGGEPVVGDSPAGRSTERILKHLSERTGIAAVCKEEGVDFALFTESTVVPNPGGRVAKSFELTSTVHEVGGIISIAKLKTHSFTRFTGAVKNLFGLVHGLKKAEYHMRMKDPETFSEMLVDLAECTRPRLTIMDGVVGMDGDGPSAGRVRPIGVIMASSNPHALDFVALKVVGKEPESVWSVAFAMRRGLIPAADDGNCVRVVGDDMHSLQIAPFKMPPKVRIFGPIPNVIGSLVSEMATRKPKFLTSKCVRCRACVDICPAEALSIDDGDDAQVAIDRSSCIRCYCCQEVCPEKAVVLRRMPGRSLGRALLSRIGRKAES